MNDAKMHIVNTSSDNHITNVNFRNCFQINGPKANDCTDSDVIMT